MAGVAAGRERATERREAYVPSVTLRRAEVGERSDDPVDQPVNVFAFASVIALYPQLSATCAQAPSWSADRRRASRLRGQLRAGRISPRLAGCMRPLIARRGDAPPSSPAG